MDKSYLPVYSPSLPTAARSYVMDCLDTAWLSSLGAYVGRFEQQFAAASECTHALAVSSGTSALHLALAAARIGPGDEVIVPALTFVATANAVTYTGARPVLADVDPETWTIDPADVERRLSPRTRAIIPVHLYGHPADMDPLLAIARSRGLLVIEDAAEAHGATYKGRRVGGIGHIGCFSFYGNKMISTGEGGMVTTNDSSLAERVRLLRDHAMDPHRRYFHTVVGFNYRMTNLQAAVGCAQIESIDTLLARTRAVALQYTERLRGVFGLTLPVERPWATNVFWMFSVLVEAAFGLSRDAVMKTLEADGIETRPFFIPLHKLPPYASNETYPVAERVASRGVNLPSGPGLGASSIERVCSRVELAGSPVSRS